MERSKEQELMDCLLETSHFFNYLEYEKLLTDVERDCLQEILNSVTRRMARAKWIES